MLNKSGYTRFTKSENDKTQGTKFNDDGKKWRPIWIKFLNIYAGTADRIPTLKKIVQEMGDDVILLHISMFFPGTNLTPHYGITMGNIRYHWGLFIPSGDLGLRIENSIYRWKTGEGIQFDDTHLHSAWNNTNQIRLVIFADIPRRMNPLMNYINRQIINLVEYTSHIKSIQERMQREGIKVD